MTRQANYQFNQVEPTLVTLTGKTNSITLTVFPPM
jgi:hypothetical protein